MTTRTKTPAWVLTQVIDAANTRAGYDTRTTMTTTRTCRTCDHTVLTGRDRITCTLAVVDPTPLTTHTETACVLTHRTTYTAWPVTDTAGRPRLELDSRDRWSLRTTPEHHHHRGVVVLPAHICGRHLPPAPWPVRFDPPTHTHPPF